MNDITIRPTKNGSHKKYKVPAYGLYENNHALIHDYISRNISKSVEIAHTIESIYIQGKYITQSVFKISNSILVFSQLNYGNEEVW